MITSCAAEHAFFLSVGGDVYAWGRHREGQCGVAPAAGTGTWLMDAVKLDGARDFVPPLAEGVSVYTGATGAMHSLLVTTSGALYAAGSNAQGQCGLGAQSASAPFHLVTDAPFVRDGDAVVDAACGRAYSLVCTASGRVYAMGSTQFGALGTGVLGWRAVGPAEVRYAQHTTPVLVPGVRDIKQVASGEDHAVALDYDGLVYVWGHGRGARLGCGTQQDQYEPVRIAQFTRKQDRIRRVCAGRAVTACVDQHARLWVAGTWRLCGDGGLGQAFLIYKPLVEDYEVAKAACGADTMQSLATPTVNGHAVAGAAQRVLAWGEGAVNGELPGGVPPALPEENAALAPMSIVDVASARHTTFWLARPVGAYSELARFPETIASSSVCLVCEHETPDDGATLLECDRCENPYHLGCLTPALPSVPDGEWLCDTCRAEDPHQEAVDGSRKRRRR